MIGLVSPVAILLSCWTITLAGAWVGLSFPDRFELVELFLLRQSIAPGTFAVFGAAWLALALATWVVTDRAAAHALPDPGPFSVRIDPARAARLLLWATLCATGVTAVWIVTAAQPVGGPVALVRMAIEDPDPARDALLSGKLFPGMRLAYAALPGTGALAAGLLALGLPGRAERRCCLVALVLSATVLMLLPIVMSQRLLTLQFAVSTHLAICLVRGRLVGIGWLACGAAAFATVWILREAITNPTLTEGALNIAFQKALYYCANDLWNSFAPLGRDLGHTGGGLIFSGIAVLTGTDGLWSEMLAPRLAALETMKGGGEFSLLTTAFVDFGIAGGTLAVAAFALFFRLAWQAGRSGFGGAMVYAQLGAALFFSSHGNYVTHQNLLASLALVWFVLHLSRPPAAVGGAAHA